MRSAERLISRAASDATAPPGSRDGEVLGDLRFRALLEAPDWHALPEAVRQRFSKRLSGGATVVYTGHITEMRASLIGRALATMLRVVGAPLPLDRTSGVAAVVTVTEDAASGGQTWTRLYARDHGFPQVIHSSKRFAGPTGLEEHIGYGICMALKISVERGVLAFRSAGYSIGTKRWRMTLPRWLSPGDVEVRHEDRGNGSFQFSLRLTSPWAGELMYQAGLYREQAT